MGLHQLVERAADAENALIIACDHITDAGNFGAIVRTADVVGATGVLIPNRRCARVTTATYKTSAGAVAHVPTADSADVEEERRGLARRAASEKRTIADRLDTETRAKLEAMVRGERGA